MGPGERPLSAEVVVVNWRRPDLTLACLESVREEAYGLGARVTVVDNGSGDDSVDLIARGAPWARLVPLDTNRGFAAGVGAALRDTVADVVVLLNNDAVAAPGFIAELLRPLERDGLAGASTARLLLAEPQEGRRLTNSTGNVVDRAGNGADRDWLRPHPVSSPPEVFGFCGGACALRVDAVRDSGGLDESLFMYYEDTDLSWKLRRRGWTVVYAEDAVALHRHASSSGVDTELFVVANARNRMIVALRHGPWPMAARAVVRTLLRLLADAPASLRSPARRREVLWRAKAVRQFVRAAPRTLRERRQVDARATVSRREVAEALPRS
ncbi:glycosyltransferase family 2 protein [Frigoribacterium sp. VKM Ac-2530]|uniref:glycosyltransferase family 2 protein n=1 Tax=Frigoribacterium sp. VKM Ac-2530 TaxID=2783822 RepID=UPI00188B9993|nr:glycosyltransferase family 2 protein [Frigoribacterium sp. VKM Ac-2530]